MRNRTHCTLQEGELLSAVAEYRAQLTSLEELLSADPTNAEVREVYEQLQGALSYTLAALDEQQAAAGLAQDGAGGDAAAGGDGNSAGGEGGEAGGGSEPGAAAGDVGDGGDGAAAAAASRLRRGGAANNARMHPANRYYRQEPDFAALAREYDELRPYVRTDETGRAHLDTTSWAATRALTACLLRHDFGLRWWLPEGQLVPPVPNRANYIHWLHDLLDLSGPAPGEPVRGLDIGCGANFIYCLLGAVLYGWHMVGVDVTEVAARCCKQLIEDNPQVGRLLEIRDLSALHQGMQLAEAAAPTGGAVQGARRGRIRAAPGDGGGCGGGDAGGDAGGGGGAFEDHEGLADGGGGGSASGDGAAAAATAAAAAAGGGGGGGVGAEADALPGHDGQAILVPAFADDSETFAFTMCNPPFFESMREAAQNPNTAFGGTAAEMVCPGGELAFVLQMLVDSEALRERVHWFSTMVGKKTTLKAVRKELHSRHVTALRTTELAQGKTSRWAVAWSWQVDPNKATQPLRRHDATETAPAAAAVSVVRAEVAAEEPRRAAAVQAAPGPAPAPSLAAAGLPVLPRRYVSFTVQQGGSLTSRTVLQEVGRLLRAEGCGPLEADAASWSVAWPVQGTKAPSRGAPPRGAVRRSVPGAGLLLGALGGPQVGPLAAGGGGGGGEDRLAKRSREEGPQAGGSWVSNIKARLRVAQQQRGRLEVVASIPNSAPDAAARVFTGVMAALERGLGACAAPR